MTNVSCSLIPAALCLWVYLVAGCNRESPTVPIPPEPIPARIAITPASLTFDSIGLTQRLAAEVFDMDDKIISYAVVSWSSSDPAVVAVSPQGDVVARGLGTAQITARYRDVSATADVTASQDTGTIEISRGPRTLPPGSSTGFRATVYDRNHNVIPNVEVMWKVSDPSVATVDLRPDGTAWVTAVKTGTTQIIVTFGNLSATASLTVQ